ncbi:hypothetical protein LX32DRAFT_643090 [Colletotrichum zoysiae]|uniref:Uncharacterized protein n=1 Tax=Colletotrichum zoysiae TaxID=1216348 RepID=A0AAD9HBF1_9PEZI|nr:hypothetical protein LX32DRAFT_643090 [Colletotrichum zoysiae]
MLNFSHVVVGRAVGKLFPAPIELAKTYWLLDMKSGTGIWVIAIGDKLPRAEIVRIGSGRRPAAMGSAKCQAGDRRRRNPMGQKCHV